MTTTLEGGRLKARAATPSELMDLVTQHAKDLTYPVSVKIEEVGATLDYKAILFIWFKAIADQLTARSKNGEVYTVQGIHDIMVHRHFGYTEPVSYNNVTIQPQLITITYPKQKTRPELYDFCRSIESWCADVGVMLPANPSQYEDNKQKETA